jgi:hypothetical protein
MKKILIIGAILMAMAGKAAALNVDITENTLTAQVYDKFELTLKGDFGAANPYDYSRINIRGYFKSPAGKVREVDGFYMQDFDYSPEPETYTAKDSAFKIRFAPDRPGKWMYSVKVFKKEAVVFTSAWKNFTAVRTAGKKGFIRVSGSDPLFMEFDNKEPFFAIGEDLAWSRNKCVPDYTDWMQKLGENGANLTRIWMAPWSLGIEWGGPIGNYSNRQVQAYKLDQIIGIAEKNGMYIQLCLVPHGEFSTTTNTEWANNPYNLKNDGLIAKPEDFFTDKVALTAFGNRLRYIIARWGYSDRIFAWEVFNEVDLTDNYDPEKNAAWHKKIFEFIKEFDINRHLLTTSFSNPMHDPAVWKLSGLDFTQTHTYDLKEESEKVYELCEYKSDTFHKPHIMAEFGISAGGKGSKENADSDGVCLHNVLWAGAFTLSFGAPMAWFWDTYVDANNLYYHFRALADFIKDIGWLKESLTDIKNRQAYYKSAEGRTGGPVMIYPVDSWEKAKKNNFMLKNDGNLINKDYLCAFLFGKAHEDMKNDPMISIKNEQPVRLAIKLEKVSDDNELAVSINGAQAFAVSVCAKDFDTKKFLDQWKVYQADINIEYVIDVPAGDNEILLENKGRDWIKMDSIRVENFLDARLAPVFVSGVQGKDTAYLWLKSDDYGWDKGPGTPVKDAYIDVDDLAPGRYVIFFYETYTGSVMDQQEDIVDKDAALRINLPEFSKDIAVKIKKYKGSSGGKAGRK